MGDTSTNTRKAVIIGLCALAFVACAGLAWWQWQRFSSANGSFQNLGYVLQWPLFGLAPAYMVWRWRKLRARAAAQPVTAPTPPPAPPQPRPDPVDADDELAAYNRYLAALNADQENR